MIVKTEIAHRGDVDLTSYRAFGSASPPAAEVFLAEDLLPHPVDGTETEIWRPSPDAPPKHYLRSLSPPLLRTTLPNPSDAPKSFHVEASS
jgi:hypothetical protein